MVSGPRRSSAYSRPMPRAAEQTVGLLVEGAGALDLEDRADLQVILQVRRRPRPGRARPGCRSLQQGRRDRCRRAAGAAASRWHRAPARPRARPRASFSRAVPDEAQADGAAAFEDDAGRLRAGQHGEVGPALAGRRKALARAPAHAAALVDLEIAAALVVAAVEVGHARDADLGRRLAEGVEDLPGQALLLDPPLAARAVHLVGAGGKILGALEVRQDVVPAPAAVARLAPAVVVARLAAHVDHAVDRRAAAEHAAARIVERAAVQAGLGLGLEAPVGARVVLGVEVADRDVDPDPVGPCRPPRAAGRATAGSAESRLASTQPAVPAPTMT